MSIILGVIFWLNRSSGEVEVGASTVKPDEQIVHSVYLNAPKAMYVWGAFDTPSHLGVTSRTALVQNHRGIANKMADFALMHKIDRLLLYVGCCEWDRAKFASKTIPDESGFAAMLAKLNANKFTVDAVVYINDDPNDLTKDCLLDIVNAIHAFNVAHPLSRFAGIHVDQEPGLPQPMVALLNSLSAVHSAAARVDLPLSSSIKPLYLTHRLAWDGEERTMFQHIQRVTESTALMAYSSETDLVVGLARQAGQQTNTTYNVAVETGLKGAAATETLHYTIRASPINWFNVAANLIENFDEENKCVGEGCRVGSLVIHDFVQYWHAIYGQAPYYDEEPHGWA